MKTPIVQQPPPANTKWGRRDYFVLASAILVVILLLAAWLVPAGYRPHSGEWRVMCASNLRQIGTGLLLYANDHGGMYPNSFATVLRTEDLMPDVFVCQTDDAAVAGSKASFNDTSADCSYLYFGDGLTNPAPENAVVAMDRLGNHDHDGINVLFGDGHVEFIQTRRSDKLTPAWWTDVEAQINRHARPILLPAAATQPSR